jgi:hypothetical protein
MRWPVIGCEDAHYGYVNHHSWRYAPRDCTTGGKLGTTEGIAGARWRGWGRSRAIATGYLIDGLGFEYPAKIVAYDLYRTNNFLGGHHYAAWYPRLHVVATGETRGGAFRGPFDVIINSTPEVVLTIR